MAFINWLRTFLASTFEPITKQITYTVRYGFIKGCRRKGGIGIFPKASQLSREEHFLNQLDLLGKTVYDVGGFEGLFTIFFSRRVTTNGRVFTFEPNPANVRKLIVNIALNRCENVRVYPIAIGNEKTIKKMVVDSRRPASGSLNTTIQYSLKGSNKSKTFVVKIESIDNLVHHFSIPIPDFVKIDVEGFEWEVLNGMIDVIKIHHPSLFIEIHGLDMNKKIENVNSISKFLLDNNYLLHHVEKNISITEKNCSAAAEGHLFASYL